MQDLSLHWKSFGPHTGSGQFFSSEPSSQSLQSAENFNEKSAGLRIRWIIATQNYEQEKVHNFDESTGYKKIEIIPRQTGQQ